MKANVQYNDYLGTTAADRSDVFIELAGQMTAIIIKRFGIPLDAAGYRFIGVAVSGTKVDKVLVRFYFRNTQSQQVVKYYMYDANLQDVLDLYKRFEFQVGEHLEDIDETMVEEIENTED